MDVNVVHGGKIIELRSNVDTVFNAVNNASSIEQLNQLGEGLRTLVQRMDYMPSSELSVTNNKFRLTHPKSRLLP